MSRSSPHAVKACSKVEEKKPGVDEPSARRVPSSSTTDQVTMVVHSIFTPHFLSIIGDRMNHFGIDAEFGETKHKTRGYLRVKDRSFMLSMKILLVFQIHVKHYNQNNSYQCLHMSLYSLPTRKLRNFGCKACALCSTQNIDEIP